MKNKAVLAAVALLACSALAFAAEEQREEFRDLSPQGGSGIAYEPVVPGTMNISVEGRLELPTRIKFTPDGRFMLVAELHGKVWLFGRKGSGFIRQEQPFFDLGGLNVDGERGLTGLFFGAGFDENAAEEQRDIFLSYQANRAGDFHNYITRVTFSEENGSFYGKEDIVVYESREASGWAHQIQDGVSFVYEGKPHILVSVGDSFIPETALDPEKETGKLLLMQRDGSDPLGKRPFRNPKVQAIGIRNAFGIAMLPGSIDPRRRVLGAENGVHDADRFWLIEAVDFGHEVDAQVSLGYKGSDTWFEWSSVKDVNAPGSAKPEAVLATIRPVVSPTSLSLHPGKGIVSRPGKNQAAFVAAYYGETRSVENFPGKQVVAGLIYNLDSQPSVHIAPIIQRSKAARGALGNPVAMDVDPVTGDIYFADITTGELYRAELDENAQPVYMAVPAWIIAVAVISLLALLLRKL